MKIVVIGATGIIGKAVVQALSPRHSIIQVGRSGGEYQVDLASKNSIQNLFEAIAPFDAVVSAAGEARFNPLESLSDEDFQFSLSNKLMGQVNLVRVGLPYINDNGSFTLTSGVLTTEPMLGSAAISLVNAGLEGFMRAAALEAPRGIRVNVVSPPWVTETLATMGKDVSRGMPAARVAAAYLEAVESQRTGEVLDARLF
ncbi:short chain dehydrogenase [[Phormidium ambiguum] IAM M-71]|uniref:Short chain dehydrogenase n=1 Tax=[Phormidium ambiguum] IAM M-71 TaxID=454136 RepID=A0A1U7IL20_9CYAN|nr:short chain dehydrogenase [Phormidium ambiguum]OKH37872.1 short chain dehydrogenase [Phormidium ambiguum IAM M-71]